LKIYIFVEAVFLEGEQQNGGHAKLFLAFGAIVVTQGPQELDE
jgi:hypothetical protein